MSTELRFDGRLVVVTGAASGIGACAAGELAGAGAGVVALDIDTAVVERAAAIGATGAVVDVRDREAVARLFRELPRPPDALLTCAGGASRCPALEIDDALLSAAYDLNTAGFLRCAQEAARSHIAAGRSGLSILHVLSSLYTGPGPDLGHFAAAKAASASLVQTLAREWAVHGIRVNGLVPGPVDTPATRRVWDANPAILEATESRLPAGRVGRPEDLLWPIQWLLHPSTEWVTGSLVTADGGWSVSR